jgi:hypothetical protein
VVILKGKIFIRAVVLVLFDHFLLFEAAAPTKFLEIYHHTLPKASPTLLYIMTATAHAPLLIPGLNVPPTIKDL